MLGIKTLSDEIDDYITNTYTFSPVEYENKEKAIRDIIDNTNQTLRINPSRAAVPTRSNEGNAIDTRVVYSKYTNAAVPEEKVGKFAEKVKAAYVENGLENVEVKLVERSDSPEGWTGYDVVVDFKSSLETGDIVGGSTTKDVGKLSR